jgi:hypothetical protein
MRRDARFVRDAVSRPRVTNISTAATITKAVATTAPDDMRNGGFTRTDRSPLHGR